MRMTLKNAHGKNYRATKNLIKEGQSELIILPKTGIDKTTGQIQVLKQLRDSSDHHIHSFDYYRFNKQNKMVFRLPNDAEWELKKENMKKTKKKKNLESGNVGWETVNA